MRIHYYCLEAGTFGDELMNGSILQVILPSVVVAVAVFGTSCTRPPDRAATVVLLPPKPGWYAIVWAGSPENVKTTRRDSRIDFSQADRHVIVVAATFEEGWARDEFHVVKNGERYRLSEFGWEMQSGYTGTLEIDGQAVIYDAFFVGPSSPNVEFDISAIGDAMRERGKH